MIQKSASRILSILLVFLLLFLTGCTGKAKDAGKSPEEIRYEKIYSTIPEKRKVSRAEIDKHILELTSEAYEGRRAGTKGEKEAGLYLARKLQEYGALPFAGNDYFQEFSLPDTRIAESEKRFVLTTLENGQIQKGDNVLGWFVSDPAAPYIIISANYDHLGREPNGKRRIFPGGNRNASGVAAVLEIARLIGENQKDLAYNVIIGFWSGKEAGLYGSQYFSQEMSTQMIPKVAWMLNFDTIGSFGIREYTLWKSGPAYQNLAREMESWKGITLVEPKEPIIEQISDHLYFGEKGIPSLTVLSADWARGTGVVNDTQYGVNGDNIRILAQYTVSYLFSFPGVSHAK